MQPDHSPLPTDEAAGPSTKGWKKTGPLLLLLVVVALALVGYLLAHRPPTGSPAPAAPDQQTSAPYQHPTGR